jgi:hypothetical protein
MRLPIRIRLALVFAGITAVVLAVAAAALLVGFRGELARTIDEGLQERAGSLSRDPRTGIARMAGADETFAQLQDRTGTVLAASPGLGSRGLPIPASLSSCEPGFLDQDIATPTETIQARIYAVCMEDGSILLVGQDVDDQREAVARLTAIVAVGGPILLLAMAALGWTLAGAALRPVERLRAEAATIQSLEPSRRLAVPDTGPSPRGPGPGTPGGRRGQS